MGVDAVIEPYESLERKLRFSAVVDDLVVIGHAETGEDKTAGFTSKLDLKSHWQVALA